MVIHSLGNGNLLNSYYLKVQALFLGIDDVKLSKNKPRLGTFTVQYLLKVLNLQINGKGTITYNKLPLW